MGAVPVGSASAVYLVGWDEEQTAFFSARWGSRRMSSRGADASGPVPILDCGGRMVGYHVTRRHRESALADGRVSPEPTCGGSQVQQVNSLVTGRRGITPDAALGLAKVFGMTPGFWVNHQFRWDLFHAQCEAKVALKRIRLVARRDRSGTG